MSNLEPRFPDRSDPAPSPDVVPLPDVQRRIRRDVDWTPRTPWRTPRVKFKLHRPHRPHWLRRPKIKVGNPLKALLGWFIDGDDGSDIVLRSIFGTIVVIAVGFGLLLLVTAFMLAPEVMRNISVGTIVVVLLGAVTGRVLFRR